MIRLIYDSAKGYVAGKLVLADEKGILYAIGMTDQRREGLQKLTARQIRFLAHLVKEDAEQLGNVKISRNASQIILTIPAGIGWLMGKIKEADRREIPTFGQAAIS